MCGIVGYIGKRPAQSVLLGSLARLEYRGYDSCGIALASPALTVYKDAVRVAELAHALPELSGTAGIGHTRWATHGAPCKVNSHPHTDCTGRIAVVHNGVINNYQDLTDRLTREGHTFVSETDTEVIAHLIERYYYGSPGRHTSLKQAVDQALHEIQGTYAIIVMAEEEQALVVARRDSPLVIGLGDGENFIASDVPAILNYTDRVIYLEDGDSGVITSTAVELFHAGEPAQREEQKILWSAEEAQKGGYEHYLIKEIHEQPRVIRDTLAEYLARDAQPLLPRSLDQRPTVMLVACGTSFYAASIGKYLGESLLGGMAFRAELASELNTLDRVPRADLVIALTQSGETLDTLTSMKRLKASGAPVLAIAEEGDEAIEHVADTVLKVPPLEPLFSPFVNAVAVQLLAYYAARKRGCAVDFPRNLAKSVTVE